MSERSPTIHNPDLKGRRDQSLPGIISFARSRGTSAARCFDGQSDKHYGFDVMSDAADNSESFRLHSAAVSFLLDESYSRIVCSTSREALPFLQEADLIRTGFIPLKADCSSDSASSYFCSEIRHAAELALGDEATPILGRFLDEVRESFAEARLSSDIVFLKEEEFRCRQVAPSRELVVRAIS